MIIYLLNSDARNIPLADQSVQCIITSPPYYGLRDYGTAKWEGGDPMCDHSAGRGGHLKDSVTSIRGGANKVENAQNIPYRKVCGKCGAVRIDAQIGLERTPQEYVASIVAVMRECWRVLKDDGVLWLNLGDSYMSNGQSQNAPGGYVGQRGMRQGNAIRPPKVDGLKPKDLIGIPWRCAFALQDAGWYLRSDIIWSKPNSMPESVTDRPTKAHEYIFLLTKRARYYYDAEAIREPISQSTIDRWNGIPTRKNASRQGLNVGSVTGESAMGANPSGRNRHSVWTVATMPYSGAHFATFPPKLIEPMVLAGSRPGDLILDPFAGTATVGRVAIKHQRRFVGLDLNLKYIGDLAHERTSKVQISMQFATEP